MISDILPFAQVSIDGVISSVAQYGAIGGVLAWFMFRFEKKMDRNSQIINDLVMAITIDVASRDNLQDEARRRAQDLLERSEARSTNIRARAPGLVQ